MARAHEIAIAADTQAFDRGIRDGIIDPLDDAERALDQLGDAAEDAGREGADGLDKIGESADDLGRDSKRGIEKLEDALRNVQRESEDAEKALKGVGDGARDAGRDAERGMKKAEGGVEEFKNEAEQSAKEAAASFDGSFESIGELGQEVAAQAFSGFGPAGVAAGVGVASAVGVIVSNFEKIGEAADEARESAFQMAYDVSGALDQAGYSERLREWTGELEKVKQVRDLAVASGWEEVEVLDALASGGPKLDSLTQAFDKNGTTTRITLGRLGELQAALDGTAEGFAIGGAAAQLNERALYDYAREVGTATGKTDDLGNAIYKLPDETEVVVDANTKRANENVDAFQRNVNNTHGKSVTISARAETYAAQHAVDGFVARNNGREFKIYGRTVMPPGAEVWG